MAIGFTAASSEAYEIDSAVVAFEPFSMGCWFYSNDATTAYWIFAQSHTTATTNYCGLVLRGDLGGDPIRAESRDGSGGTSQAVSASGYSALTWHHALGVFAADNDRRVYLDGTRGTDDTGTEIPAFNETSIGVLSINTGRFNYFDGRIGEAFIASVTATDAQAKALASGVSPLHVFGSGNLVGYWPLFHTGYTQDASGQGNDVSTTLGTPVNADHPPVAPPFAFDFDWGMYPAAAAVGGTTIERSGPLGHDIGHFRRMDYSP